MTYAFFKINFYDPVKLLKMENFCTQKLFQREKIVVINFRHVLNANTTLEVLFTMVQHSSLTPVFFYNLFIEHLPVVCNRFWPKQNGGHGVGGGNELLAAFP
jgi:hypothetical protein